MRFGQIILKPRLLKIKRQETLFIEKVNFNAGEEYRCDNYNQLKLERAKKRKDASFSFLENAWPPSFFHTFFKALMKSSGTADFSTFITFTVSIIISASSSRMRTLEATKDVDAEVTCSTTGCGVSAALNCDTNDKSINPLNVEYSYNQISGAFL